MSYNLTCDIIDAYPIEMETYLWRWGDTIEEIDSPNFTIPVLDRDAHNATFQCAAVNTPGQGDFGIGLPIRVWCKYILGDTVL